MWFYYKCPQCQVPVSVYDTEDNDYIAPKLLAQLKDHYAKEHGMDKFLQTDENALYDIKTNKQTSAEEPTW